MEGVTQYEFMADRELSNFRYERIQADGVQDGDLRLSMKKAKKKKS